MPLTSSPWTVVAPALVVVLVCMAAPVTLLRRPDPLGHSEPRAETSKSALPRYRYRTAHHKYG